MLGYPQKVITSKFFFFLTVDSLILPFYGLSLNFSGFGCIYYALPGLGFVPGFFSIFMHLISGEVKAEL